MIDNESRADLSRDLAKAIAYANSNKPRRKLTMRTISDQLLTDVLADILAAERQAELDNALRAVLGPDVADLIIAEREQN
jgi:purine-nucleoside phosphorylase